MQRNPYLPTAELTSTFRLDLAVLCAIALAKLLLHAWTNGAYGFHRDELPMLDDAQNLAWGFVAYPPVTPAIARLALGLFGPSLSGLRFFAAAAQSMAMVFAALIARDLGGRRFAQTVTAVGVAISPISWAASTMFQYVTFDFLWWVLLAWMVVRLIRTDNARWWLAIGAVIGVGMLTKYTMGFYALGIAAGTLLTPMRRHLRSPWLWAGAALSILIFLPNLRWQMQHDFISLEFLKSIHARDVRIGRTDSFLLDQFRVAANPATIPLWISGLWFFLLSERGRRFRMIGWMAVIPLVLFILAKGRGYYTGPLFPMLIAGGSLCLERWLDAGSRMRPRWMQTAAWSLLAAGAAIALLIGPYAPVNSRWWSVASALNSDLMEEIGWPDLTRTVAGIYRRLSPQERANTGIFAGNYGEAGALHLYGPAWGLPHAISGTNSYWLRGYGEAPQNLILVGSDIEDARQAFQQCAVVGRITNSYGIKNEESTKHPDVLFCRGLKLPWPELWPKAKNFG
ncbi:MAG: glycosyltransferase family 39 protein [Thermoanaerobaculia bacterium]